MQYGEFSVTDYLLKNLKNISAFIPASAQEKGIDLLLYRHNNIHNQNQVVTFQVKMSRTYYNDLYKKQRSKKKYPYDLWFNRFEVQPNADWYILVGIYARHSKNINARADSTYWDTIMLAFTNSEIRSFIENVRQKKDSTKYDKMFGFSFDNDKRIDQTRGCAKPRDMSKYLIENRINDINNSFDQ